MGGTAELRPMFAHGLEFFYLGNIDYKEVYRNAKHDIRTANGHLNARC